MAFIQAKILYQSGINIFDIMGIWSVPIRVKKMLLDYDKYVILNLKEPNTLEEMEKFNNDI